MAGRAHPGPDDVRAALSGVIDPEIGRSIVELGMVREIDVDRRGDVRVRLALTTPGCPLADRIEADVRRAVGQLGVGGGCEVSLGVMNERERMELAVTLRESRGSGPVAPRVYAVASGKGGVGKSTVTANLAVALADQGLRVGLIDADVWGYSIPQLFGVRRNPVALKGLMLPVPAHGVRLMSVGFLVEEDSPVVWRGPMLHKAIEQFLTDVHWGELDVLLLDLPPGTGDVTLSVLEFLPEAALLAVTTPQAAARAVAVRVGRMARDMRMPVAGVVENMTAAACPACGTQSALFGSGGGRELAESVGAPLLGQVPLDLEARRAGDEGIPLVRRSPGAASAAELVRIAAGLPTVRRSLVGRALPLLVS